MTENEALLERMQQGDPEAESDLINQNMGLVYNAARHFTGRGHDMEDLIQIGSIGLIKAVRKFDPAFGVQLSTYAVPMITGEIRRFLRDDGALKVSRSLKEKAVKGKRCRDDLSKKLGREPTISEISAESGISGEELIEAFTASAPPESIYAPEGENLQMLDRLGSVSHEEEIVNRVMLKEILSSLPPRERQVIVLRYYRGKTQTEIAGILGVSQVQVSRIERSTLGKLRKMAE